MEALVVNILRLMAESGRNEKQVGEESGVGQPWLNRVLNPDRDDGIRSPGIAKLRKLAGYFGVSVTELAPTGDNDAVVSQPVRLDVERMATAMGTVDAIILRTGLTVTPLDKARAVIATYQAIGDGPMTPENVVEIAAIAMDLLRESK